VRSESECETTERLLPVKPDGLETPHIMVSSEPEYEKVRGTPHGGRLSRRVQPQEHGCRISQMQFDNFAPDSVGYKVMSKLLAKLTMKGDVRI
jgi:hypothetical protein